MGSSASPLLGFIIENRFFEWSAGADLASATEGGLEGAAVWRLITDAVAPYRPGARDYLFGS
jgi:hypothetical protein